MSTMLVTSGMPYVTTVVVAGISPSMEPSAALLELLTVHSTCNNIQKGKVRVGFWVGKCVSGHKLADAQTGWHSLSRIFIEEVPKAQQ